jgi:hypothetical protein
MSEYVTAFSADGMKAEGHGSENDGEKNRLLFRPSQPSSSEIS